MFILPNIATIVSVQFIFRARVIQLLFTIDILNYLMILISINDMSDILVFLSISDSLFLGISEIGNLINAKYENTPIGGIKARPEALFLCSICSV